MKPGTVFSMLRDGTALPLIAAMRLQLTFFRVSFLAAASSEGLLGILRDGPVALEQIAERLGIDHAALDGLEAWLDFGVSAGLLRRWSAGYGLRGALTKQLASPAHDSIAAWIEELALLDITWILQTPQRLREGRRFTLDDQDGRMIARSSRTLERFVFEAVDLVVPPSGTCHLLDVGCGSGIYIRHAAERNRELTALGIDLQADVAEAARENLRQWGLARRAEIEAGDVRKRTPDPSFDVVMLNNNMHYFPESERLALLKHLKEFLRTDGRLLVIAECAGRTPAIEILNLWGVMTEGCGPLPTSAAMTALLREAGFESVKAKRLVPFMQLYSFVAS